MIAFGDQVERLRQRQIFAAHVHTRRDILNPRPDDARLLGAFLDTLDPVIDYDPDPAATPSVPLPYGLRSVRYALSPIVQERIDGDGRVDGLLVRRMPTTLAETVAFIAHGCPVALADWDMLRRLIYVDPELFAELLFPVRAKDEAAFNLILSREYPLALSRFRWLGERVDNQLGFTGSLIDLAITFGEMERADSLATGMAATRVDVNTVRDTLLDQRLMLAAMAGHTAEGEYLLGLLANPDLLRRRPKDKPVYGPWSVSDPLTYDPAADFANIGRYAAFVDDVLALLDAAARRGTRSLNADLTTYWGVSLDQLAEITFIAAGETIPMRRGPGREDPETGPAPREEAIRILADGFRARHDQPFAERLGAGRQARAKEWTDADDAARVPGDKAPPTPFDARRGPIGASRIQQNRDRAQLMTSHAGKPGHNAAIDGRMWLEPRAGRDLWRALTSTPPSPQFLKRHGFDDTVKQAFGAIRAARVRMPQLLRRRTGQDARLLADLSTTIGWLSGRSAFATRMATFVSMLPELRAAGWLDSRLGDRWGGGGDTTKRAKAKLAATAASTQTPGATG